MFNKFFSIVLVICLAGCSYPSGNSSSESVPTDSLENGDTIYSSDTLFIQDIDIKGDHMLLQISDMHDAFAVVSRNDSGIVAGISRGEGPRDIISGKIMKTCAGGDKRGFVIYDSNIGKVLNISAAPDPSITARLIPEIVESRALCLADSFAAGHRMGAPEQFFINKGGSEPVKSEYFLTMSQEMQSKLGEKHEYVMSNCFTVNTAKDRLLSFNFFFDCAAVYSLDGKFIRSNRADEDVTAECSEIIDNGNYMSYCHPYATDDACYVKAIKYAGNEASSQYLHKFSWEGELLKSYRLPENVHGGYAVTADGELLCIVSEMRDNEEIYHIIKCELR